MCLADQSDLHMQMKEIAEKKTRNGMTQITEDDGWQDS